MVAEKNNFSSNAKCNFANGKVISKKKTLKSASPHLLRRPAPATFTPFHPKFFRFPPPPGEVIKIYSPLFTKGGGVQTMIKLVSFVKSSRFDGFVLALFCIIDTGESLILENFHICWLVVFSTNILEQINFWLQLGPVSFALEFLDSFCNFWSFWSFSNHDVNIKQVSYIKSARFNGLVLFVTLA